MKRWLALLMLTVLLSGCSRSKSEMDEAIAMRAKLLAAAGCSFQTEITADFGAQTFTFTMDCQADNTGRLTFTVREPESLAGITGVLSDNSGKLTFDGKALAFDTLAEGQISPVSAPWVLVHTLRGGYMTACARGGDGMLLSIDDSYADDALRLEIRLDREAVPGSAEIFWKGRRILSLVVKNFQLL